MSDDPHLAVTLANEQEVPVDESRLVEVARKAAIAEEATGELSILLVDSERMAELNSEHMREEGPTDVLAFPIDGLVRAGRGHEPPPVLIGEVVVCPEVAARQAGNDLACELDLLVAHGVLHILGYHHDNQGSAGRMRDRERKLTGRAGATAPSRHQT